MLTVRNWFVKSYLIDALPPGHGSHCDPQRLGLRRSPAHGRLGNPAIVVVQVVDSQRRFPHGSNPPPSQPLPGHRRRDPGEIGRHEHGCGQVQPREQHRVDVRGVERVLLASGQSPTGLVSATGGSMGLESTAGHELQLAPNRPERGLVVLVSKLLGVLSCGECSGIDPQLIYDAVGTVRRTITY